MRALVEPWLDESDPAAMKSRRLTLDLLAHTPAPFSRRQFHPGHITCTGLVLHHDQSMVLLIHHLRLDRWLLPGGHIEPEDEAAWEAARREVIEETGVPLRTNGIPPLVGIDVHGIPPNRREPYHLHHDLVFAFRAASDQVLRNREIREAAWCREKDRERFSLDSAIIRAVDRAVPLLESG